MTVLLGAVTSPPPWVEIPAIVAGALAGALFAQRRGLDLIGVLAIAIVSGLGGGMMRDVLLARVPLALREPDYLWAVAAATILGAFFAEAAKRIRWALLLIDAIALGLFTVIGTQSALLADLPVASAILLGTITGVGGTVIRDILVGELPPRMLRRGAPYASAAALGGAVYAVLVEAVGAPRFVSQIVVVILVCSIRGLAAWRGWESPGPLDVTPRFLRSGRASGSSELGSADASEAPPPEM